MRCKVLTILFSLLMFIVAPVVDATVCPDCSDTAPFPELSQRIEDQTGHAAAQLTSGGTGLSSPGTDEAQDLCPFCSQSAAATGSLVCSVPSTIGHTCHLPKLLALSDLSQSITKPPQN